MRNFLDMLKAVAITFISIPILLIACVVYLLFVPFDIIRYHRMPYYKDFKTKYDFFITSKDIVKMYNRLVQEQLSVECFKNNDYEYFVKDGQVLVCGCGYEGCKQIDGEWYSVFDDECNSRMTMKERMEYEIEQVRPEHKCLPAKFLVFYDNVKDMKIFEKAKECPYFYCVFSDSEDL